MPLNRNSGPSVTERIVSALCYLTGGIAGIIYIIISRNSFQSTFFRFHFLQSIVLAIISLLLNWAVKAFMLIIPQSFVPAGVDMVLFGFMALYSLLFIYGLIWSLLGKFAEIPWLSDVVRNQMR